jgi:hypothetical protein
MLQSTDFISLEEDAKNGELHLIPYGAGLALVFTGPQPFIERWFNWSVNRSVISRSSILNGWVDGFKGTRAYVCPKNRGKVLKGLVSQMAWEIVARREVEITVTRDPETEEVSHQWNEELVAKLAEERANHFMVNHIKTTGLVMERAKSMAPIYSVATPGRAESSGE